MQPCATSTVTDVAVACAGLQAWKEKGQGLLTLRQPSGGGSGPAQIVFTTEAGRVLVNAALYRGVKVVPQARTLLPAASYVAQTSHPVCPYDLSSVLKLEVSECCSPRAP